MKTHTLQIEMVVDMATKCQSIVMKTVALWYEINNYVENGLKGFHHVIVSVI